MPGARTERDWRAALASDDLDAVVVTLPTALHGAAALAAIARGVAMYLEKPLASTLEEATAVRDAWRATALTVAVGFNSRFHPLLIRMRQQVRDGRIGDPRLLRCAFTVAARYDGSWRHHAARAAACCTIWPRTRWTWRAIFWGARSCASARHARPPADGETLAVSGEIDGGVL